MESVLVSQKPGPAKGRAILERVRIAMSKAVYVRVPVGQIRPMAGQPRAYFHSDRLARLAESMKAVGQMQPGIIRPVLPDGRGADKELLDGERRWRAVQQAGLEEYRAMLVDIDDEAAPFVVSVISNFNREAHTTLEVVDSIAKMHEQLQIPLAEIAESIGFTLTYTSNLYAVRKLVPEARDLLDPNLTSGRLLPTAAAIEIARLPAKHQLPLALRVMNREVKLSGLRREVVGIAKKNGIEIRERNLDPSELRKKVDRRTSSLLHAAEALKDLLSSSATQLALRVMSSADIEAIEKRLVAAANDILASHEVISEVNKKKSPVLYAARR